MLLSAKSLLVKTSYVILKYMNPLVIKRKQYTPEFFRFILLHCSILNSYRLFPVLQTSEICSSAVPLDII